MIMGEGAMVGAVVLVVGPSGVGKDTLLAGARAHFAADATVIFQRRDITRPAAAGGEDHRPVTMAEFDAIAAAGGYALSWTAHDLRYGVPVAMAAQVAAGTTAVVNVSRGVIDAARARFAHVTVIEVTAPAAVLAARLAARGREDTAAINKRLARVAAPVANRPGVHRLVNDGSVADGVAAMVAMIKSAAEAES
ncbi:MAG: phosphonate metabolism protein/1,5-bisphosphokinase (PRPP-forming) PhnN [Pseudomonadota bacterium]|nr:phosphonate metabolism protein/1,5-bisphosphokinase (PRPP-forming) PhnN [Pseudomonadota bacterium]